jgi:hypothetical protein
MARDDASTLRIRTISFQISATPRTTHRFGTRRSITEHGGGRPEANANETPNGNRALEVAPTRGMDCAKQ